jgi:hypothetical protein
VCFFQQAYPGLTKEELDYLVTTLLNYLEEGNRASPESGFGDYENGILENTECRPRHGLWYAPLIQSLFGSRPTRTIRSPGSPTDVVYDNGDDGNLSEVAKLEADDRVSLELVRTECHCIVSLSHDYR